MFSSVIGEVLEVLLGGVITGGGRAGCVGRLNRSDLILRSMVRRRILPLEYRELPCVKAPGLRMLSGSVVYEGRNMLEEKLLWRLRPKLPPVNPLLLYILEANALPPGVLVALLGVPYVEYVKP